MSYKKNIYRLLDIALFMGVQIISNASLHCRNERELY